MRSDSARLLLPRSDELPRNRDVIVTRLLCALRTFDFLTRSVALNVQLPRRRVVRLAIPFRRALARTRTLPGLWHADWLTPCGRTTAPVTVTFEPRLARRSVTAFGQARLFGLPGGPVWTWFLSPQPLPGRTPYCFWTALWWLGWGFLFLLSWLERAQAPLTPTVSGPRIIAIVTARRRIRFVFLLKLEAASTRR